MINRDDSRGNALLGWGSPNASKSLSTLKLESKNIRAWRCLWGHKSNSLFEKWRERNLVQKWSWAVKGQSPAATQKLPETILCCPRPKVIWGKLAVQLGRQVRPLLQVRPGQCCHLLSFWSLASSCYKPILPTIPSPWCLLPPPAQWLYYISCLCGFQQTGQACMFGETQLLHLIWGLLQPWPVAFSLLSLPVNYSTFRACCEPAVEGARKSDSNGHFMTASSSGEIRVDPQIFQEELLTAAQVTPQLKKPSTISKHNTQYH